MTAPLSDRRRRILERLDALTFHLWAGDEDAWTRVCKVVGSLPDDVRDAESVLSWLLLAHEPGMFGEFVPFTPEAWADFKAAARARDLTPGHLLAVLGAGCLEWSRADAQGFARWACDKARTVGRWTSGYGAHRVAIDMETMCRFGDALDVAEDTLLGGRGAIPVESLDLVVWVATDAETLARLAGKVGAR